MAKIRQGKQLSEAEVQALRAELDALPRGSVTRKVIKGVARFYLQWAEKGRTKSRYLAADEVEAMREKVVRRRELIKILREYPQESAGAAEPVVGCGISIKRGDELARWARTAAAWERCDKFPLIMKYLRGSQEARVCVVYGLRRTGKTADDRQARHLRDAEMLAEVERRFGKVSSRSVLYRGKPFRAEDGVCWRNVEEFLGG